MQVHAMTGAHTTFLASSIQWEERGGSQFAAHAWAGCGLSLFVALMPHMGRIRTNFRGRDMRPRAPVVRTTFL